MWQVFFKIFLRVLIDTKIVGSPFSLENVRREILFYLMNFSRQPTTKIIKEGVLYG